MGEIRATILGHFQPHNWWRSRTEDGLAQDRQQVGLWQASRRAGLVALGQNQVLKVCLIFIPPLLTVDLLQCPMFQRSKPRCIRFYFGAPVNPFLFSLSKIREKWDSLEPLTKIRDKWDTVGSSYARNDYSWALNYPKYAAKSHPKHFVLHSF